MSDETIIRYKPGRDPKPVDRTDRKRVKEFAKAYHLPIGTVRDWEQGRTRPDAPAQALLKVIEGDPELVRKALVGR